MEESKVQNINHLYNEVREIIVTARQNAVRSVDFSRVQMYWQIGRRILEEEQKGKERADYGTYLLKNLAKKLEPEYGSGFSYRQLNFCRQFYRMYPIANALRSQFNWTQYRLLIAISDDCKREYYELEAMNHCWTARELERQINSQLYERLLLSNDKESVLAVARKERIPQTPQEIIKFGPVTDVCELLRPHGKDARRESFHRHSTLHIEKQHGSEDELARKQHFHPCQPIPIVFAIPRTVEDRD